MLVGRMDGIAVQAEAHQDGFALQFFFKKGNNWDASAASLWNGRLSEGFFIRF